MNWIDVTMPITETMQVYKNKEEKRPSFEITSDFATGSARETRVHLDCHTGTHIDAPLHMIPTGGTIDQISLDRLMRRVTVIDVTSADDAIHTADLVSAGIMRDDFVLFKSRNSFEEEFNFSFVYIAEDAAHFLADLRVSGVGVDGLGVERNQPGHPTHKALFAVGAVIIEGLRLAHVAPGAYDMIALPLPLRGLDASPARILLQPIQKR